MKSNKIIVLALVTMAATSLFGTQNVAQARGFDLGALGKILSSGSSSTAAYATREKMIPDGRVYTGGRTYDRDSRVTNVYNITITKPSVLLLNVINDSNETILHSLRGGRVSFRSNIGTSKGSSGKDLYILNPGNYSLEFRGMSNFKGANAFRVAALAQELPCNGIPSNTRSDMATPMYFGSEVCSYFLTQSGAPAQAHYYTLDIKELCEFSITYKQNCKTGFDQGYCTVELLNSNGSPIGNKNAISASETNSVAFKTPPGRYYIRVGCNRNTGAVYSFSVEQL